MARGIRYQHRSNCKLITPYGEVELDERGSVVNLGDFDENDLLSIDGFVDTAIFGEGPPPRRPDPAPKPSQAGDQKAEQGPSDEDYWGVIRELTSKGGQLNSEGYLQMEVLTAELRDRGWPPISGTRRIRITDEHRPKPEATDATPKP